MDFLSDFVSMQNLDGGDLLIDKIRISVPVPGSSSTFRCLGL